MLRYTGQTWKVDMKTTPIGEHLSSLDAGLQVMTMFAESDSINVTSVSRRLGCSRATAYRILNTLRNRGIVVLGPTGRGYFPGAVLLDLARPRGLDQDDRQRLRPVIADAVARTGETVHVATLVGTQILFFDGEEPDRPVRATLRQGYLRPAHAISAGKLLLSQLTNDQVRALYPHEPLPQLTPLTISTVAALLDELDEIRRTGHAFSRQEVQPGLCGTAVALRGRSWRERVALCATVPLDRGHDDSLLAVHAGLRQAAAALD